MNRIGIDIGGTFTDVVLDKSGRIFTKKYKNKNIEFFNSNKIKRTLNV